MLAQILGIIVSSDIVFQGPRDLILSYLTSGSLVCAIIMAAISGEEVWGCNDTSSFGALAGYLKFSPSELMERVLTLEHSVILFQVSKGGL